VRFKHALNKTGSVKRRDRTGTVYARVCVFCTPLKINSVNACPFHTRYSYVYKEAETSELSIMHKCNMSNHGLENLSVKLTLLIHIPEGRQTTNMST